MEKFGVDRIFTPENPVFSARGTVVTNIAHIPAALTAIMRENGARPDFSPEGSLALKPWFGSDQGLSPPRELDLPAVEALSPYGAQIAQLNRQIGAVLPRQPMKNASGAAQMDPTTQITSLHGVSMLDAAQNPMEANLFLALLREAAGENDRAVVNAAMAAAINLHGRPELAAAQAAREAGNAPNVVLAAAASLVGPRRAEKARRIARVMIERFAEAGLLKAADETFDLDRVTDDSELRDLLCGDAADPRAQALLAALQVRGVNSVFLRYVGSLGGHPTADGVLAAVTTTLAWGPLMRKRISRLSAECLPWWIQLFGVLLGASAPAEQHGPDNFCGVANQELLARYSVNEIGCLALLGRPAEASDVFVFQTLVGLLLSNGPGTISAQGAKGAVSSDGPETPERVQLNKGLVGFLSHSGYSHGGNGYEGIAFLIEQFRNAGLADPADPDHGIDLDGLAARTAAEYARYKSDRKSAGSLDVQKIPGVNHPVFKDRPVNYDPREVWVHDLFTKRGEYNAFHEYYHALVQALFDAGVSRTVYCVNIDAVIAALLLKMLWQPLHSGALPESALETAAFTIFLYARMLGCAAETDDHLNRGRNMDTRTVASRCRFVA
jgi:hypothetical protein